MNGRKEGRMDRRKDGWKEGWIEGRMDGQMEGRKDGWMNGRQNAITSMFGCRFQLCQQHNLPKSLMCSLLYHPSSPY
jgi:hypothetical protein